MLRFLKYFLIILADGFNLFDLKTRLENIEDHLDAIHGRLDDVEIAAAKDRLKTELDELKGTVMVLLADVHNTTSTIMNDRQQERHHSTKFGILAITAGVIIITLTVMIGLLTCCAPRQQQQQAAATCPLAQQEDEETSSENGEEVAFFVGPNPDEFPLSRRQSPTPRSTRDLEYDIPEEDHMYEEVHEDEDEDEEVYVKETEL